jgi:hypothetical protein
MQSQSSVLAWFDEAISRRDFLKVMGSGAIVLGLTIFGVENFLKLGNLTTSKRASASTSGSWAMGSDTLDAGIHAALLEDGKIFYLAGSGNHAPQISGPFRHAIWDPATDTHTGHTLNEDLFCVGQATLPNGNVLLAGGTLEYDSESLNGRWHGLKAAYEVDFSSGSVGSRTEMAHGRWYPTCTEMSDGTVLVVNGWDEYGCRNFLAEIYNPASKSWKIVPDPDSVNTYCAGFCATQYYPDAGQKCYPQAIPTPDITLYPRMHYLPNGLVYAVGQGVVDRVFNPATGKWYTAGNVVERSYGTSILLPLQNTSSEKGKILVCGGSPLSNQQATNSAEIVEPNSSFGETRRSVQSMASARRHLNPVLLPTGQVIVFGGNRFGNNVNTAVFAPEMFDPDTETWSTLPSASVPRLYHSNALLMIDGRVWTASTNLNRTHKELRTEIFSPWYISETRPTISGSVTVTGGFGGTITIPTLDAASITKVSLLKQPSATHHYNTDQRLIWLQIESQASSSVTASAPLNNKLAPPGMYLIHVVNSAGVPSIGKFVRIDAIGSGSGGGTFASIYSVTGTNSYLKLYRTNNKRAGELLTPTSTLIGEPIKRVSMILRKSGNPTGTISVILRRGSDNSVALRFGTIDATTLAETDQTFTLTAPSSYTFAVNDKVLVEWPGTTVSTDQVWVKRRYSSDPSTGFDGSNTRAVWWAGAYSSHLGSDLAGEWFKEE